MADEQFADYTVPGLATENGHEIAGLLQIRLHALNDLQLTLKHVHWNVTGPHFIGVHEMIDPQVTTVRGFVDELAERIATLGGSPSGRTGELVGARHWEDYPLGKADTMTHLTELDKVYSGVISDHREVIAKSGQVDPITEDILIGQTKELEQFQWFLRAHQERSAG